MNGYKEYLENIDSLIRDEKWVDNIIQKGSYCCMCGHYYESQIMELFEYHHIAGKNNSPITIPVCPNCHKKLTNKQKSWDEKWTEKDNSPKIKFAFMLRGYSDISRVMSEKLKELSNKILNGEI